MGRLSGFTLVAVGAALLVLSGCAATPAKDAAATSGAGVSLSRAKDSLLPVGLFGLDQARIARTGQVVEIDYPDDCESLLNVFEASQWSVKAIMTPNAALNEYLLTLRMGAVRDMVWLYPSTVACHASVTEPTEQKFSFAGPTAMTGTSRMLPFQCQKQGDAATDPVTFSGMYDGPGDFHFMLSATFAPKKGMSPIDPDSAQVSVVHGATSFLEIMGAMLNAQQAGTEDDSAMPNGAGYYPSDSFEGTASITSTKPLAGTLTLTGLTDNEGGGRQAVTVGFRCAQ